MVASILGMWLFSLQHRFETTQWTVRGVWSLVDAALRRSTSARAKLPGRRSSRGAIAAASDAYHPRRRLTASFLTLWNARDVVGSCGSRCVTHNAGKQCPLFSLPAEK